mmetsp:Transcript_33994/g.76786  ORF Transcript_33994/g.76786 Transcript_33994/m.76786 type:complete len:206 (-) Transcript_33994:668-1285(-)
MDANRSLETTTTSSASKSCARDSARVKGKYKQSGRSTSTWDVAVPASLSCLSMSLKASARRVCWSAPSTRCLVNSSDAETIPSPSKAVRTCCSSASPRATKLPNTSGLRPDSRIAPTTSSQKSWTGGVKKERTSPERSTATKAASSLMVDKGACSAKAELLRARTHAEANSRRSVRRAAKSEGASEADVSSRCTRSLRSNEAPTT